MRDQVEVSHSGLAGEGPTDGTTGAGGGRMTGTAHVDLARVNATALANLFAICSLLLPRGKREGSQWVTKDPTRHDRSPSSLKINLKSGLWNDFAMPDRDGGSDPVCFAGYAQRCPAREVALRPSHMLKLDGDGGETGCNLDMTDDNGLVSADASGRTTARLAAAPGRFCVVHLGATPSSPRFEIN